MWRIAGIFVAMLAFAPAARADIWRGSSSQGRPASVMTGGDGAVNRVRLSWRAPCGNGKRYATATVFTPPFDSAGASAFGDTGTYKLKDQHGYVGRITVKAAGTLGAGGWSGTLAIAVQVAKGGVVVDHCSASKLTWSAKPV